MTDTQGTMSSREREIADAHALLTRAGIRERVDGVLLPLSVRLEAALEPALARQADASLPRTEQDIYERCVALHALDTPDSDTELATVVQFLPWDKARALLGEDMGANAWASECQRAPLTSAVLDEILHHIADAMARSEGPLDNSLLEVPCFKAWAWLLGDDIVNSIDWGAGSESVFHQLCNRVRLRPSPNHEGGAR